MLFYVHAYKYNTPNTEPTEPTHHLFWPDCSDQWNDQLQYMGTVIVWDQWTLWPSTPVSLATLSLEAAPGLVGVIECGCDHAGESLLVLMHHVYCIIPRSALCSDTNGVVRSGSSDNRPVGSRAANSCDNGFSTLGESIVEHVRVTEPGVDQLQCVSVSGISCKPNINSRVPLDCTK